MLGRIGLSKTLERAMQIAEFVRREVPVFVLCGLSKSAMARLNRRDHLIADARQIGSGLGCGRCLRRRGIAMRARQSDPQNDRCRNCEEREDDRTTSGRHVHDTTAFLTDTKLSVLLHTTLGGREVASH